MTEAATGWGRLGRAIGALVVVLGVLGGCSSVPISAADHIRASLVATRLAGTAQIALDSRTALLGQSVDITGNGALDIAHQTADLTVQVPALGGAVHAIIANGTVFAQLPSAFAAFLPGAKAWASVDLNRLTEAQFGAPIAQLGVGPSSNPLAQLGYLQGIQDAREIGSEPVNGTSTTHYAASIDLEKTPAAQDPSSRPAVQRLESQIGTSRLPVDVWIDEQGRLRKLAQTLAQAPGTTPAPGGADGAGTSQTTTITVTSFGGPDPMPPPPPDQVTDLSALIPGG